MKLRLIMISLIVIITISPTPLRFWSLPEESLIPVSTPYFDVQTIKPNPLSSFDYGSEQDCLEYSGYAIKIVDCQNPLKIRWQTPVTWNVTETISADLNQDGKNELVILVWRAHKVWPIDTFLPFGGRIADFHDRSGVSCHLILVGWDGEKYRELWAGSSLIDPIFGIRAVDLDKDGSQELVALEGKYDNKNVMGNLTVWDWSGFGFRLRDRLQGKFSEFGIVSIGQNVMIVTN